MYDKEVEPFSNPLAPPSLDRQLSSDSRREKTDSAAINAMSSQDHQPLTNDDFRKLMMTPRVSSMSSSQSNAASMSSSVRSSGDSRGSRPKPVLKQDLNENRKKKKKFYATLKKQEDDTLAELAKRYRDRARERRDGANPDYRPEESMAATTAAYRAVAPDLKSGMDAAERRKQMIQESKYLGGDMEHTHLVKGLDYALLQKVKAEINVKEKEDKDLHELEEEEREEDDVKKPATDASDEANEAPVDDPFAIKSKFASNIISALSRKQTLEKNELFLPGRMAYIVDLEDEFAESDIPTTVIRSKADCPNMESITTLSTNDIVINKLTQILSYLRQGGTAKKAKKPKEKIPLIGEGIRNTDKADNKSSSKAAKIIGDDGIYNDIGDYMPDLKRRDGRNRNDKDKTGRTDHRADYKTRNDHRGGERDGRDRNKDSKKSRNYFDKPSYEDEHELRRNTDSKSIALSAINGSAGLVTGPLRSKLSTKIDHDIPESYAECYPGAPENDDAVLDSDDEVDYSKMDLGNKKGLIGRWDFDTAEEYGDYMSLKEALPKAAFQYGVKMADGRKTRRVQGKRDEKAKLDRDLQKINAIIQKRKAEGTDSGVPFSTPNIDHKRYKTMH